MNTPLSLRLLATLAAPLTLLPASFAQTNGTWNVNANGNWSATGSWLGGNIADGAGSVADFSQLDITTGRTVTIDGTVASRTIGTLLFGDATGPTFSNYTIAASGSGTLTFDNSGSTAVITQGANSGANTISAPVLLADSLNTNNNSASLLTVSGTISASTVGTKTITNQGTGAGGVTLSGVISNGTGSVAIVQNSATSTLTLTGANTFDTGVFIKQGTLVAGGAGPTSTALGSGTLLLGDTSGSAAATFAMSTASTVGYANAIIVQAGGTGKRTITHSGNGASARPNGNILLNSDLTLEVTGSNRAGSNAGSFLATSGVISGTGNLNIEVNGGLYTTNNGGTPQGDSLSVVGNVTTSGAINNVGTGEGRAIITGNISNASSVNQNSATSMLTLNGANTYSGATNVNAGVLRSTTAGGLSTNSVITVASGAALQLNTTQTTTQTLTLSGKGTDYSTGALSATSGATYAGAVILADDTEIASSNGINTLTLSGGITGLGKNLTVSGVANTTVSGAIATGSGGLIKEGTGVLTLSGANTFTGLTQVNAGALLVSSAGALGGGGDITLSGGTLRHSSTNTVDYASRIVNSTGPVAIDTNSQNVTYAGNIASSNTGGLTKTGAGRLTLSGTNAFTGPIVVNGGALTVTAASALPGQVFIDTGGALNSGSAYANVNAWLASNKIDTASTGVIALTGNSSEAINLSGFGTLGLGASTASTYSGTLTPAGTTYRLGGGGATLTLSGTNALTGSNGLVVGNSPVVLSGANNLTGSTTVASSTLTLSGAAGGVAGSSVTVSPGATLAITSSTVAGSVARASSVTLNRGTLTVAGNNTANSTDAITNALTIGADGNSTVTLSVAASSTKNTLLTAASLGRTAGGTALIRGANLGVNAFGTANSTNIQLTTPTLVGGVLVGVVGDTAVGGSGFGATGGLLTHDGTNGVRLLSGYTTSLTSSPTALDNAQLTSASGVATTTLTGDTVINSLSLKTSAATDAGIAINGSGKLTLNSGVLYSGSVTSTTANTISNAIDFNNREAIILVGGTADLNLSGVLGATSGNGLTIYAPSRTLTLSGADANTYTGTTTVNGGTLALNKTAGVNAITGNLVINSGGTVSQSASNQIADSASVTVNGGALNLTTETFTDLTLNSGSASTGTAVNLTGNLAVAGNATLTTNVVGTFNVAGSTNLSDGGSLTLVRSQNINGAYDSVTTLGALNITNRTSGAYTAITINHGSGLGQSGAKLILGGDVTFTGNSTNTNTVFIDAIKGSGRQGVIALTSAAGNRTFTIGNGAAASDLRITAALLDGAGGASGLVKTGLGTLALSGANTYSGNTIVNAGGLVLDQGGSLSFYIGTNGVNNSVTGTGAATFNGSFNFDLTNAAATEGNSWFIVDTGTLAESFAGTFAIAGFTQNADVWTNGSGYSFSEATGILSYTAVPEPSTVALLGGAASLLLATLRRRRTTS